MDVPVATRIFALIVCIAILWRMFGAKRGVQYFIRRIPGIDAIEEALGRATEMGKPIVFTPGIDTLSNMQVLAGLSVLGWVAKKCASLYVQVIVPLAKPTVVPAAEEIVRNAYREAGAEEHFRTTNIRFISEDQSAFAAGTVGILAREKAAAGFYFGAFGYESLLISENGNRLGIIQVAATADYVQIPFFICACDYTLIGEELYAASAYLSRDPMQVGSLTGQDMAKALILLILLVGSIAAIFSGELNPVQGLLGK